LEKDTSYSEKVSPGRHVVFSSGRFKTWISGFDWITGLFGSIFLNQNDVVLVKKQKSTGHNRVFNRVLPGQPVRFFLSLFFLQSGPVQYRINQLGQIWKPCMVVTTFHVAVFFSIFHVIFFEIKKKYWSWKYNAH